MKELSLLEHQHVCTLNTSGYIAHTCQVLGDKAISRLFGDLYTEEGQILGRTHLGQPVYLQYFLEPDNWFDNDLNLHLFANAHALGLDLVETGKVTVTSSLIRKNGVVLGLGLVQILGTGQIFKGANRVNALFNRTKDVKVSEVSASGGLLTLNYRPGFKHSDFVTLHNIGAYTAVLEYLGYRDVKASILTDRVADGPNNGLTEIEFTWRPKRLAERMQFFLSSFVSKKLLSPYLRSSRYLHDFHYDLISDYQYQLTRKNQLLREFEVKYLADMKEKNAIIKEQAKIIKQADNKLNLRDTTIQEQLEHWLSTCPLPQLQNVPEAANALHLTEKTFSRKVQTLYQTTPKRLLREQLIKRSIALLEKETVEHVALQCGYANTSSYTRAFKAVMGHPPTDALTSENNSAEPHQGPENDKLSKNDMGKSEKD